MDHWSLHVRMNSVLLIKFLRFIIIIIILYLFHELLAKIFKLGTVYVWWATFLQIVSLE